MKKLLSMLLACFLAIGTLFTVTACGGKKKAPDTPDDLEIFYWNSGNGSAWLDKTIAAFEKKNPGVNIIKNYSATNSTWENDLSSRDTTTIDLFINTMPTMLAYTQYIEPLDEVLEATDENGVKLISKYDQTLLDGVRGQDGKIYAANWGGGTCGLVYKKDKFAEYGYKIPRTTKELEALAGDITDDERTPFIFAGNADYWLYCYMVWAAQYGGVEMINNFWNAGWNASTRTFDKNSFINEARKQGVLAMEEVAAPAGYTYQASNQITHTAAQTLFLQSDIMMMPNGSWLENEMKTVRQTQGNVAYMKLPITSALGTKLGISENNLCKIIDYVDGTTTTKPTGTGITDAKIEEIRKARNIVYTEAPSNKVVIPNYANAKEWAKKFIQFMLSEEGLSYFYDTLQIPTLAKSNQIDPSGWSVFMKSAYELSKDCTYIFRNKKSPFFYNNGLEFLPYLPQQFILAKNASDRLTGEQFWTKCVNEYNNKWQTWVNRSGM